MTFSGRAVRISRDVYKLCLLGGGPLDMYEYKEYLRIFLLGSARGMHTPDFNWGILCAYVSTIARDVYW